MTDGWLAPTMLIGYSRDLPGAWGEEMVVHCSQVHVVPASVSDEAAVLVEPLSVAIHAVLKRPPAPGTRVLILGGGTIGLCTVAALRAFAPGCHVTRVARYRFQAEVAEQLGADVVSHENQDAIRRSGEMAVLVAGARELIPLRGGPVYVSGFDQVFDCVGSQRSVEESRRTRPSR